MPLLRRLNAWQALSLQQSHTDSATKRNMSDAIWCHCLLLHERLTSRRQSLRNALILNKQEALAERTRERNLEDFRGTFDF